MTASLPTSWPCALPPPSEDVLPRRRRRWPELCFCADDLAAADSRRCPCVACSCLRQLGFCFGVVFEFRTKDSLRRSRVARPVADGCRRVNALHARRGPQGVSVRRGPVLCFSVEWQLTPFNARVRRLGANEQQLVIVGRMWCTWMRPRRRRSRCCLHCGGAAAVLALARAIWTRGALAPPGSVWVLGWTMAPPASGGGALMAFASPRSTRPRRTNARCSWGARVRSRRGDPWKLPAADMSYEEEEEEEEVLGLYRALVARRRRRRRGRAQSPRSDRDPRHPVRSTTSSPASAVSA